MSLNASRKLTKKAPLAKAKRAPAKMNWGSALPLRHRYLFTRTNRLRARYLVLPLVAVLFLAGGGGATWWMTQGVDNAALQVANNDPNFVPETVQDQEDQEAVTAAIDPSTDTGAATPPADQAVIQNPAAPVTTAAVTPPAAPRAIEKIIRLGRGATLNGVLTMAGLSSNDAATATKALAPYYNPRSMSIGQRLVFHFDPVNKGYAFTRLSIETDPLSTVTLKKAPTGVMQASLIKTQAVERFYARKANIDVSLYGSALKAHIPSSVTASAIRVFSWAVDFQRDLQPGDTLSVLYSQYESKDGKPIRAGDIVYARLNANGRDIPIYRFEKDGIVDYYTADGKSIRKALLTTPVDGARISSGFGMRFHPVLGYTKMHKGIDFAAPIGTPIFAAGNGVVEKIGPFSSYGNYVRIKHNATLQTAYAHMLRFAPGLRDGDRVHQGQVIGYIGVTGRSTGPHLHYEVLINNAQVNPASVKVQSGDALAGSQLAAFKARVRDINQRFNAGVNSQLAFNLPGVPVDQHVE